jgi:exopolysaccharide biosynthesis polyprenyl glycosylphosphotransferase
VIGVRNETGASAGAITALSPTQQTSVSLRRQAHVTAPGAQQAPTPGAASPARETLAREAVYRRSLLAADLIGAALALVLAVETLGDDRLTPALLLALPLVALVAKLQGLYDRDGLLLNKTTLDEAPKLFQAATLYALLVSVGDDWLVRGDLGSRQTIGLWLVLFGTALAGRAIARLLARRATGTERVLVLGTVEDAGRVALKFAENPSISAEVAGRVALDPETLVGDDPGLLGTMGDLERVVEFHRVHRVVVASHEGNAEQMLEAIRRTKALGVQVSVLPRLMEVVGSSVEFDHLYGVTVLGVRRFGLSRSSLAIKRMLDLAVGIAAFAVLAPIMAVIALGIRATSQGPVLFRQKRIGRDGETFEVLKFRTMVADAEEQKDRLRALNEVGDGLFKIAEDPRITPIGRFLRRTSLDELPQLLNVLGGDMSLVGPRPLVPDEDRRIEGGHRHRLHLKPGMTGQWQIFGSSRIPLREMVNIDYLYVANWSLWSDVKILCRTIPYVLARRGL